MLIATGPFQLPAYYQPNKLLSSIPKNRQQDAQEMLSLLLFISAMTDLRQATFEFHVCGTSLCHNCQAENKVVDQGALMLTLPVGGRVTTLDHAHAEFSRPTVTDDANSRKNCDIKSGGCGKSAAFTSSQSAKQFRPVVTVHFSRFTVDSSGQKIKNNALVSFDPTHSFGGKTYQLKCIVWHN